MPRARFIRPEFFTDSKTGRLSLRARLLYVASWCQADIQGVLEWNADQLRLAAFPYDGVTDQEMVDLMAEIVTAGRIKVFNSNQSTYAQVIKWLDHQSFTSGEKRNGPRFPTPKSDQCQTSVRPVSDMGQTPSLSLSPAHTPAPASVRPWSDHTKTHAPDLFIALQGCIKFYGKEAGLACLDAALKLYDAKTITDAVNKSFLATKDQVPADNLLTVVGLYAKESAPPAESPDRLPPRKAYKPKATA